MTSPILLELITEGPNGIMWTGLLRRCNGRNERDRINHPHTRKFLAELFGDQRVIASEAKQVFVTTYQKVGLRRGREIDIGFVFSGARVVENMANSAEQRRSKAEPMQECINAIVIQAGKLLTNDRVMKNLPQFFEDRAAQENLNEILLI